MEPIHEFGKEAALRENLRKVRLRTKNRWMTRIGILVVGGIAFFAFTGNMHATLGLSSEKNSKKEKKKSEQATPTPGVTISAKWDMPQVLTEISGVVYLSETRFAGVQDESGTIYIYNTTWKKIEKEIPFGPAGDYEDLAVDGKRAWIVRADGKIFSIDDMDAGKPVVSQFDTHLTVEQNVEGLSFDGANNRLLVAIKNREPGNVNYKGIYAFDLSDNKMPAQPVFKLDLSDPVFEKASKKKGESFMPSAIGIHPVTRNIYITDGRNSSLLILDPGGKIKKLFRLDQGEFAQPEGISF